MYDIKRKREFTYITVGELINELKKLPNDANVLICGDDYCYIHIEADDSTVCLDNEPLDDCYE